LVFGAVRGAGFGAEFGLEEITPADCDVGINTVVVVEQTFSASKLAIHSCRDYRNWYYG
jgi:hypothetical protein